MKSTTTPTWYWGAAVTLSLLLSACGDSVINEGGGAGDSPNGSDDAALILPFVGIYDLQDNWNGQAGDRAYLSIRQPGASNTSEVVLFDIDDIDNCVPERNTTGTVRKDPFGERVLMDDIPQFNEAILQLTGSILTIVFFDDFDINSNGNRDETVQVTGSRVGLMETDLGPSC